MALRLLSFSSLLRFSPATSPRPTLIPSSSSSSSSPHRLFPHLPSPSTLLSPSNPLSRAPHSNGVPRLRPISSSRAPGSDSGEGPLPPTDDGAAADAAAAELAPSDSASIWKQMKEIALFAGPATGLWICGPLMSLIDTMVIGQGSSLELAALGPGTVFCDYLCYIFMFLSIATSNMVATSLAKKDKELAQHQISMLLFVAFACGLGMFIFTRLLGPQILAAFTGPENLHIVPAANTYAQRYWVYGIGPWT